jgi:GNAT superfamily N-acetyltransferase
MTSAIKHGDLRIEQLATRSDLLPVVATWIFEEWWQEVEDASVKTLSDLLRAHLTPDRIPMTLVALLSGRPVGTATLLAHDVGTDQWPQLSPWMAAVYVVPAHRRLGIGACLVNEIAARAKMIGNEVLYLLTTEREEFYAQLGWRVFDREEDSVVMSHGLVVPP